ncbi:MAG TPA: potassium transporter KefA, partial [Rikenellaceae bacterium]|nr:potassium transporter KefA [Rikenellaceae bacterium]
ENSVAGTVSTLGNVGPATGAMGTMGSFNHMTVGAKLIFSMDMFLGRIEIYPVLPVVGMIVGRRRK